MYTDATSTDRAVQIQVDKLVNAVATFYWSWWSCSWLCSLSLWWWWWGCEIERKWLVVQLDNLCTDLLAICEDYFNTQRTEKYSTALCYRKLGVNVRGSLESKIHQIHGFRLSKTTQMWSPTSPCLRPLTRTKSFSSLSANCGDSLGPFFGL